MKANIKRLALLVIIAAIAMFIPVAMVSADPPHHHAIQGQYAATGGGTCLLAPFGFDPNNPGVPIYGAQGAYVIQTFNSEGVWKFQPNGKGSVQGLARFITLPYVAPCPSSPPPCPVSPSAGEQNVMFSFHYKVEDDGLLTVTADPGTYITEWTYGPSNNKTYSIDGYLATGTIAPDGLTITLNRGVPNVMNFLAPCPDLICPGAQMFCNQSAVLIWQQESNPHEFKH